MDNVLAAMAEFRTAIDKMNAEIAEVRAELIKAKEELAEEKAELTKAKAELAEEKAELREEKAEQAKGGECRPAPTADMEIGGAKASQRAGLGTDRAAVIRFNKQFLQERYDLRYNVLKRTTEFRPKTSNGVTTPLPNRGGAGGEAPSGGVGGEAAGGEAAGGGPWRPLTERDLNQLTVEQLEAGGGSWSYAMKLCVESSAVPSYNPVTAWLGSCPAWDGHDHIGDLARRVPTSYDRWPEFFHRWMLAVVAQAVASVPGFKFQGSGFKFQDSGSKFYGNSMVPLLIGGQGLRKTTFCRSLLPPELREYFMDDIKMDSAEQVERVLARMWLVCIDEYNAKTPREQAKIKRLLTEKDVQVRRPRSDEYRLVPRLASFIATTNDPAPLPSGDGTRRYLCVEVEEAIDLDGTIDYPQLYAQALTELQQEGCRWWFDADDEAEIQRHNQPYQQASPLETVLPSLFEPTTDRRRENLWQVQAVQKVLAEKLRTADVPNLRQLADAMKALRWPQGAACGTRGYYLKMKNEE